MKMKLMGLLGAIVMALGMAFALPPAAGTTPRDISEVQIGFSKAQANDQLVCAYLYGLGPCATGACNFRVANGQQPFYDDCYFLLTINSAYSYKLLQFTVSYEDGVIFQWALPSNAYIGPFFY